MKATDVSAGTIKMGDLIAGLVAINCQDYLEWYRGRPRSAGRVLNVAREIAESNRDVNPSVLKSAEEAYCRELFLPSEAACARAREDR